MKKNSIIICNKYTNGIIYNKSYKIIKGLNYYDTGISFYIQRT